MEKLLKGMGVPTAQVLSRIEWNLLKIADEILEVTQLFLIKV